MRKLQNVFLRCREKVGVVNGWSLSQVAPSEPHHAKEADTEHPPGSAWVWPRAPSCHPVPGTPLRGSPSSIPAGPIAALPQQQ